jgi:hypothetical protein
MKTARNFLLALMAAAISLPAADSALVNLIMPGAQVISGINVDRAKGSPFGQFLLAQMQKDEKSFNEMVAATGFDPRRDVSQILMATANPQPHGTGLVAVRGVFDMTRILAVAQAHGAVVVKYQGVDTIRSAKASDKGLFALLNYSIVLIGDEANVKAAIDRSRGAAPTPDSTTVSRIATLSGLHDAWFFSNAPLSSFTGSLPAPKVGGGNMNANMLESIQQTSGGIRLGSTVEITGEAVTRSDKDAVALMNVVQFAASMLQMNREKPGADQVVKLLDSLTVSTSGNTMKLGLSVPQADVEQFFREGTAKKSPRKSASL